MNSPFLSICIPSYNRPGELIKDVLENAGFSNVTRCGYQKGETPDADILDIYPDVSLIVEAVRGK